jgi:TPR repeat protein
MYAAGKGVPQDYVQAYKWFSPAMLRSTGRVRDLQITQRTAVAAKMDPGQIAEAEELVRQSQPGQALSTPGVR